MIQLALAFFGLAALWMATCTESQTAHRWAPIVGLCGQPFWLAFAISAQAWGLILLAIAYTAFYLRGAWLQWRPSPKRHRSAWFNE